MLQQQAQQQHAAMKASNASYSSSIPSTTNSSLPPIISTMGAGGTQFSKFGVAGNNGTGGVSKMTPPSMMSNGNLQRKRKKYKTNYTMVSAKVPHYPHSDE